MFLRKFPFTLLFLTVFLVSCREAPQSSSAPAPGPDPAPSPNPLSEAFKAYWYAGEAELTSFALQQARYGEIREGHAVLVYVTEPFDPEKQVKDDQKDSSSVSVLKLNRTKKFLTGIYPYSIMSSIFHPVGDHLGSLKISTSIQEWCGHVYMQMNQRDSLELTGHSYFESEADMKTSLPKSMTEDGLWNTVRIAPGRLPQGAVSLIPSFEYLRLVHQPTKAYAASATLSKPGKQRTYTLTYPALNRTLQIHFEGSFPHRILGWTESYPSGFGSNARVMTTTAERIRTLKSPYWRQNTNADTVMRDSLGI